MRRLVAITLVALSALALPRPAAAGATTDAALALGAFAVLNQMVRGETVLHLFARPAPAPVVVHSPRVVHRAPARVIYAPPPVVYAPPPPRVHRAPVVVYPHGRWVLARGHWVWITTPPAHSKHRR